MMNDIQPEHITLAQLIQHRLFRIPQYQRTYSWGRKQRKDLFEDIQQVYRLENRSHFMATIVGLRRSIQTIGFTHHQFIDIVDGQQRITTIILLLKAIAKASDDSDSVEAKIREDLNSSLVKDDRATPLLLQTNHDSSQFFANYLRQGTRPPSEVAETVADRELLSAMEDCESFVADWKRSHPLVDLVTLLKNRLTFILYLIHDEGMVYSVFEVLNSRGLDVSWFDRLKSMLMAIVFQSAQNRSEVIDEVHSLWTEIYHRIGLRLGMNTESLRFAATLRNPERPSRPLGEEAAAHLLHQQSIEGPEQVIETTRWLKNVTEAVDRLAATPRTNAVTSIAQARMVGTAVYLRSDFNDEERTSVLRKWENVTFRIYGMFRKDTRSAVGDYTRLAWGIVNEQLSSDELLQRLSDIGEAFPASEGVENLRNVAWYPYWGQELLYFLHRYEEHLSKEAGQNFNNEQWSRIWASSPASSIEHIRPQNWWVSRGREWDEGRMHGLGNLLLLDPGLNSTLKDLPPRKKADAYRRTGLLIAREVADLVESSGWTLRALEEREENLLRWAVQEWSD